MSLAPNITETLFALGLDREIVGVTRFCDYPQETAAKRKVGGLVNPSLEKIVSSAKNGASPSIKETWEKWKDIAAVEKENIHIINPDLVSRPAPRIMDRLETMAGIIHPEIAW